MAKKPTHAPEPAPVERDPSIWADRYDGSAWDAPETPARPPASALPGTIVAFQGEGGAGAVLRLSHTSKE